MRSGSRARASLGKLTKPKCLPPRVEAGYPPPPARRVCSPTHHGTRRIRLVWAGFPPSAMGPAPSFQVSALPRLIRAAWGGQVAYEATSAGLVVPRPSCLYVDPHRGHLGKEQTPFSREHSGNQVWNTGGNASRPYSSAASQHQQSPTVQSSRLLVLHYNGSPAMHWTPPIMRRAQRGKAHASQLCPQVTASSLRDQYLF